MNVQKKFFTGEYFTPSHDFVWLSNQVNLCDKANSCNKESLRSKETGFSLIELVTVVIIIGLLAMIGIPKYIQLMDKARDVGIESQAAIFSGAVLSARTQWVGNGRSKENDGQASFNHVVFDGSPLWLTDKAKGFANEGYPILPSQIGTTINGYREELTDQDCADLMTALLQNPPRVLPIGEFDPEQEQETKVRYLAQSQQQACKYQQQEGNSNYFLYEIKTGQVTVKLDK